MKKNDCFELEITDISDEGAGIGRRDGYVWFVKDTVPGDYVEAAVTKEKKNYGFARLLSVIRPSEDRTEPACPIARQCGGCQLQAMRYAAQLRYKERKVLNNLRRIGGFEIAEPAVDGTGTAGEQVTVEPIIGMEEPFRYRNKAQYPVGKTKDGRVIAGFYAGRTHSIIECTDCLLGCTENQRILDCVTGWMRICDIEPYDEQSGKGVVRHVLIRKGNASGQIMVCLIVNSRKLPHAEKLVEDLLALNGRMDDARITSISYNINQEATNVILGKELVNLYGPGYIEDSIRRLSAGAEANEPPVTFRISPLAFYQVNPRQMERLYSTALEYAALTGAETVWDVYCGIGTISLFLARHAKKVYGVEIIPQAIENARENAVRNGLTNVEFFVGKAEEVLPEWYAGIESSATTDGSGESGEEEEKIDVVVVDPPRKGCDEKCLETSVKLMPKRVVYVSCDSATLARDLKYLCQNGYELRKVRACDMFGQTVHTECVVLLTQKRDFRQSDSGTERY